MKSITIIILGLLLQVEARSNSQINFNPKALKREISKQYQTSIYTMDELLIKDSATNWRTLNGKFFKLATNNNLLCYLYIGRVNSCRKGGCSTPNPLTQNEESEFFDYFIIYNSSKFISNIVVYNYEASHGQEITAKGWLKQFKGYNGSTNLNVGDDIDAISGATISVNSIVDDIIEKTLIFKRITSN